MEGNLATMQQTTNDHIKPSINGEAKELVLKLESHSFEVREPNVDNQEANFDRILARYCRTLMERSSKFIGYPANLDFDYGALAQLHRFSLNNVGDPFVESNYGINSRLFEVGVLDWFASLWEIERTEYWGYVTNGGTEGNLHGVLIGRELLPEGILYTSRDSHYSVFKAARMYRMHCVKIDCHVTGQINCDDFKDKLLANRGKPAIVNVNIGTTMKGAVDDLDLVIKTLEDCGFREDRFYVHCDGALFGIMIPFVKNAPKLSFKKPIGSISVSGHKFIGGPIPCGVQITRKANVEALSQNVEYIGSRDVTITGSRNGLTPVFLWYALSRKGCYGFRKDVQQCLRMAHCLKQRFHEAGIGAMLNELSCTVVFERPKDDAFVRKWQLACEGNIAHVVVMPHITVEILELFFMELIQERAIWCSRSGPMCIAADVGSPNCTCRVHERSE